MAQEKMKPATVAVVKKWLMLALMLMYLVFAIWWLAAPASVLTVLIQRGATEDVCGDGDARNVELCRSLLFLVRFAAVYFFLILCVLAGVYHMAFMRYPESPVARDAASVCLAAFIPTSLIASVLYVDISVANSRGGTAPIIPEWFINVTNFPFVATICVVLAAEWSHRKTQTTTQLADAVGDRALM